jgi:predicted DNA-binding transcriptional regulator AlpA
MNNPFQSLEERLKSIEEILFDLKANPKEHLILPEADELFTLEDTALFLNLSKATIYTLNSKGELPSMKRSKRLYFSKLELMEYLKKGRRKTNTEISKDADQYVKSKDGGTKI